VGKILDWFKEEDSNVIESTGKSKKLTRGKIKQMLAKNNINNDDKGLAKYNPNASMWIGFSDEDLSALDLSSLDFNSLYFYNSDLKNSNLTDVCFEEADLRRVDFRGTIFKPRTIIYSDLRQANLMGLDLREISFKGVYLTGANLEGAILSEDSLKGVIMNEDKLEILLNSFKGKEGKVKLNLNKGE